GPDRRDRARAAGEAAAGLHHAKAPRARLRCDRRVPRLFGRERPRARVPGAQEDPSGAGRSTRRTRRGGPMTPMPATCREIEPELIAVAAGEAEVGAAAAVATHVGGCASCRRTLEQYRAVEDMVVALRRAPHPAEEATLARAQLESRLADLRSRAVSFGALGAPLRPTL